MHAYPKIWYTMADDTDLIPIVKRGLRISDPAPRFVARTTAGIRSLSDYEGRWLLFFAHPADFTPVCTSEFIAFSKAADRFAAIGCDLLALSVDSLYAHIAWLNDIRERFGVKVPFPVVEDPSMVIAKAYDMMDEASNGSATVRATYVIDPRGVIRAIIWYPMNMGRSVVEMLRLVAALQEADRQDASTPANWQPGEALLEPSAATLESAIDLRQDKKIWYFREVDE